MHRTMVRSLWISVFLFVLFAVSARQAESGIGTTPTGVYRGFFQSSVIPGGVAFVELAITDVHNRRWGGMAEVFGADGSVMLVIPVQGTIANNEETGTFMHESGHVFGLVHGSNFDGVGHGVGDSFVEFHGQLISRDNFLSVADARYRFRPPRVPGDPNPPPADEGTSTLIRDFALGPEPPPIVAGRWDGNYHSSGDGGDGTFMLDIKQMCADPPVTADAIGTPGPGYQGTEIVDGHTDNPFYFLGSIDGASKMFVTIGFDRMGDRFLVMGHVVPPDPYLPPDPYNIARANGSYLLLFADGRVDRGLLDFTQQPYPPNPCRPQIIEQP